MSKARLKETEPRQAQKPMPAEMTEGPTGVVGIDLVVRAARLQGAILRKNEKARDLAEQVSSLESQLAELDLSKSAYGAYLVDGQCFVLDNNGLNLLTLLYEEGKAAQMEDS